MTVGKGGWGEQSASAPGQLRPSPRFLRVSIDRCCGNILLESFELGFEIFNLVLDIFKFLRAPMLVVCNSHPLNQYLVMLDKSAHSAEGRLEGWKPISRLFCNIEENLCAIHDFLPLC